MGGDQAEKKKKGGKGKQGSITKLPPGNAYKTGGRRPVDNESSKLGKANWYWGSQMFGGGEKEGKGFVKVVKKTK